MASSLDFVEYVYSQICSAGNITYKKMFGEYGFYYDGKFLPVQAIISFLLKLRRREENYSLIVRCNRHMMG